MGEQHERELGPRGLGNVEELLNGGDRRAQPTRSELPHFAEVAAMLRPAGLAVPAMIVRPHLPAGRGQRLSGDLVPTGVLADAV